MRSIFAGQLQGARVKSASLSYVIPNGKSARQKTRALAREGSPRLLSLSGGFLAPLTSPLWGSCAVSSKCSCKQAFLLASGGMTGEGARPRYFAPLGLVRRFVGMLLQAGIPPRV